MFTEREKLSKKTIDRTVKRASQQPSCAKVNCMHDKPCHSFQISLVYGLLSLQCSNALRTSAEHIIFQWALLQWKTYEMLYCLVLTLPNFCYPFFSFLGCQCRKNKSNFALLTDLALVCSQPCSPKETQEFRGLDFSPYSVLLLNILNSIA